MAKSYLWTDSLIRKLFNFIKIYSPRINFLSNSFWSQSGTDLNNIIASALFVSSRTFRHEFLCLSLYLTFLRTMRRLSPSHRLRSTAYRKGWNVIVDLSLEVLKFKVLAESYHCNQKIQILLHMLKAWSYVNQNSFAVRVFLIPLQIVFILSISI